MATIKKDTYHHGNLRQALLHNAMEALTAKGMDQLSLRGLSKALGVTPTAVYGHFSDKTDLLMELRTSGFQQLHHCMRSALTELPSAASGEAKVRALGHAYMYFALNHSHLFDAMFFWTPDFSRITSECVEEGACGEQLLRDTLVEMLQEHGCEPDDNAAAVASFSAWALVHGISTLLRTGAIDGAIYCGNWPADYSADHPESRQSELIEQLLSIQLAGLKASAKQLGKPAREQS